MSAPLNRLTGFGGHTRSIGQSPAELFVKKRDIANVTVDSSKSANPGVVQGNQVIAENIANPSIFAGRSFYLYAGIGLIIFYVVMANRE